MARHAPTRLYKNRIKKSCPPHSAEQYIGLEHLRSGSFRTIGWETTQSIRSGCTAFKSGAILYGKLRPNLDKAVIIDSNGICSTEIVTINATEKTSNEYLIHLFHCPKFISYNAHHAFGTKMPRTSADIFGAYRLPVPPIEIQNRFVDLLSSCLDAEKLCGVNIDSLLSLKKRLVSEAIVKG